MKRILLILFLLGIPLFGLSQVGINTTSPDAQLDIKSSNQAAPSNTDGILIPKIDAFPVTNPTAAQQGMLVYLTTISAGQQPGFYYWDNSGTPQWKPIAGNTVAADADWYEVGGTTPPDAITDAMFHTGNVAVGKNSPNYKLEVEENDSSKPYAVRVAHTNPLLNSISGSFSAAISGALAGGVIRASNNTVAASGGMDGIGLNNLMSGNSSGGITGVNNSMNTSGGGVRTGVSNAFSGTGTGLMYGVSNGFIGGSALVSTGMDTAFTGAPTGGSVGVSNRILDSGSLDKTGVRNVISNSGTGIHVGIENTFSGNNALSQYGVKSEFTGTGATTVYGTFNTISSTGDMFHYGSYNAISGAGAGEHYGTQNVMSGMGTGKQFGIENSISVSGNNVHYGVQNYLNGSGTGTHTGVRNWLAGSGAGAQYGIDNYIDNTGNGDKYGIYNRIVPLGTGIHYGVYSDVRKADSYAGYFIGRFSIGSTLADNYIMPPSRGTANQVMQTDGTGNVSWQSPNGFAWSLTGNSGINPTANFIGTIDSKEVFFRHTNIPSGVIGFSDTGFGYKSGGAYSLTAKNTAFGSLAAESNTVSTENTALGSEAMQANTAASKNVAVGQRALFKQSFSNGGAAYDSRNVAVGYGSLYATNGTSTSTGANNVGIGYFALANNGAGNSNIAIGGSALGAAQTGGGAMTGSSNIAIGSASLKSNGTGSSNIAIGSLSLNYNSGGIENVAIGTDALFYSTNLSNGTAIGTRAMQVYGISQSGTNDNVAVGYEALKGTNNGVVYRQNTAVGYQSMSLISSASGNTALGYQTLYNNTWGGKNVAVGSNALFTQSFANGNSAFDTNNVAIGNEALYSNNPTVATNGINNTALGNQALRSNATGSGNVAIGYQAGFAETGSNKLYIENSNSTTPLIYGDFATDRLRVNGYEEVVYSQQTANGDGQATLYALRNRDSQNDGSGYTITTTNNAIAARNVYGDLYTFGIAGYSDNDFNRSGGVLGGCFYLNTHWGSLGYKSSANTPYGIYASGTNTYGNGAGRMASNSQTETGIGGGFYGGVIGSWSKGTIGSISSGNLFASYNNGDEYTAGRQVEIVETSNGKKAAYTMTSTESMVYKKGKITLVNGAARVVFSTDYAAMLGDIPVVTTTPMGQCNGIYIEAVDKNGFTIKELSNGTSNVSVSWIAVGDRIDAGKPVSDDVLSRDFNSNINEVMFNENNKEDSAKGIWSDGSKINFGKLPENSLDKSVKKDKINQ